MLNNKLNSLNKFYTICETNKDIFESIKEDIMKFTKTYAFSKLSIATSNAYIVRNGLKSHINYDILKDEGDSLSNLFSDILKNKYPQYDFSDIFIYGNHNNGVDQNFFITFKQEKFNLTIAYNIQKNLIDLNFIRCSFNNDLIYLSFTRDCTYLNLAQYPIDKTEINLLESKINVEQMDGRIPSYRKESFFKSCEDFIKLLNIVEDISKNSFYKEFGTDKLSSFISSLIYPSLTQEKNNSYHQEITDLVMLNTDLNLKQLNSLICFDIEQKILINDTLKNKKSFFSRFYK